MSRRQDSTYRIWALDLAHSPLGGFTLPPPNG